MGKDKEEEKDGVKASPFSLLAMLPGIAGDAAKIFASPEKDNLRQMQQGGGVGSRAIAAAQQRASRDQLSAQAVGHGATRGLGILGASDRANDAAEAYMPALGMTAAREQALATDQLRQNKAAQIASASNLGWKLTGGIGGAIANMVAAKDQGEQGAEAGDPTLTGQPGMDQETGLTPGAMSPFELSPGADAAVNAGTQENMNAFVGAMEGAEQRNPGSLMPDNAVPAEQLPGASPDAIPAQTPEEQAVEREKGAEARRDMNSAQLQADWAVYQNTLRAMEPAPDAPLGTARLVSDAPAPLDDTGIQEWVWGGYRDNPGEWPLSKVHEILDTYQIPRDPPAWLNWAPGGDNVQR